MGDALAEGDEVFAERFGVAVEPGWDGFPEVVPFLVEAARSSPGAAPSVMTRVDTPICAADWTQ